MRVLVVSQYFWPENFRVNELVSSLHARGVEVEVLTGKPNYPSGRIFAGYLAWGCIEELHEGVRIHRVPIIPRGKGTFNLGFNYLSFVLSALFFGPRLVRRHEFEAILVFGASPILQAIPAIWLKWLKGCPVLLWVQDLWPESISATGHVKNSFFLKTVELLVKWIYRNVDLLLVQSRAFIPTVRAFAGDTPIAYYPNSFIYAAPCAIPKQIVSEGFNCDLPVLFAGNLGTAQAVQVILEAATLLRNIKGIHFLMVGEGSKRDWMQQQAIERNLKNIFFLGSYPIESMPNLLQRAEVLLVTLADSEIYRLTIPSKVQAYLASGRPIIACLNGAGAEIVLEAGAGLNVPAEDALALAQAVQLLYSLSERERREMGARGRKYYEEHFSHDKLVDELMGHFDQVIQRYQGVKS
jgi:glycosyltransferase involved in cell wall biosynthesis